VNVGRIDPHDSVLPQNPSKIKIKYALNYVLEYDVSMYNIIKFIHNIYIIRNHKFAYISQIRFAGGAGRCEELRCLERSVPKALSD